MTPIYFSFFSKGFDIAPFDNDLTTTHPLQAGTSPPILAIIFVHQFNNNSLGIMDPAALSSLTPEQKQAVMAQAQGQANQQIMASMVESMTVRCFDKCVGTSVSVDWES